MSVTCLQRCLACALLVLVAACGSRGPYACTAAEQCVQDGVAGRCDRGFCAFPDPSCEEGFRFEPSAGDGLAGTCTADVIDASVPDAELCGLAGLACCAGETCTASTCEAGTCQSCVADVAFGRWFGCVLKTTGAVWCSGTNGRGQLGNGAASAAIATPTQVRETAGGGLLADVTALGVGREHACAVRAGGTVWCWGANGNGQLGNGATSALVPTAVQVIATDGAPLTGMVEVRSGFDHSCARDGTGELWCWGLNAAGQLGDGTTTTRSRAARVLVSPSGAAFAGANELQIGANHNCVRRADSTLWCWGGNGSGNLGDGSTTNRLNPIPFGTGTAVSTGNWHTCRVNPDTTIACAGWNHGAVFGIGIGEGYNDGDYPTAVLVLASLGGSPFTGATRITTAGSGTCALRSDASVTCWGDGQYGQNGTGGSRGVPTPVLDTAGAPLAGFDRLAGRWGTNCARRTSGAWLCWGRNSNGELGEGTFASRGFAAPLKVSCP